MSASDRGLRNPRHTFGIQSANRLLMPFMMAPLRPGETLVGLRLEARSALNQMIKYFHSVPVEVEYCIWKVSVRQIGEFFVDMFTSDLDDTRSTLSVDPSTGLRIAPTPINTQGHQSRVPLQVRDRPWAGEVGQADGEVTVAPQAAYAPYVSHAIWHIARMCYDLRLNTLNEMLDGSSTLYGTSAVAENPNLYQTPPPVGRLVRSATNSAMGWQAGPDQTPTATSLSEWASRLSVVDNPNRTYQEYLKAFGVDPRRIEGMPEPVLMQRRTLKPHGSPQVAYVPALTAVTNTTLSSGVRAKTLAPAGGGANNSIKRLS